MIFTFQFVNVVYYIDWFVDIKESLHSLDKAHLIMMCDFFNLCWILFARIKWTNSYPNSSDYYSFLEQYLIGAL